MWDYTLIINMIWVSHKITADISITRLGNSVISDHAPVMITWCCSWLAARQLTCHLNNCLLESVGVADSILSEISAFSP